LIVVAVAQLVESRIVIPVVVGSSPISHPKRFKHLRVLAARKTRFLEDEVPNFGRCAAKESPLIAGFFRSIRGSEMLFSERIEGLGELVNAVLERELAAYRVVARRIVPVTEKHEIAEIQDAIANGDSFDGASHHIATALAHLSDRLAPDFRNSIKESISAVESAAKAVTGRPKAELGPALNALESTGKLHGALRKAYLALYGYTSDSNGIRHALMDEPNLTADDAKYFLVVCSAFVNYLKTRVG
jgi:hypothetical protein